MNKKSDNLLTKLNKKIIGIIIGIIVGIIIIVRIVAWHNSPLHNPDSPFYNTDITFGYYQASQVEDEDDGEEYEDTQTPIKRVSIPTTISVVNNVFAIMYKNGDGHSASYKYYETHSDIHDIVFCTGRLRYSYRGKLGKWSPRNWQKTLSEFKNWKNLVSNDKKATKVLEDWNNWMSSCLSGDTYDSDNNFLTHPQYYVTYDNNHTELYNGQKVSVGLGGKTDILEKYNVDLRPVTVRVKGLSQSAEKIGS